MRKIINYLRCLFCEHEWEYVQTMYYPYICNVEYYRCKKCGKHWEYTT